MTDLDWPATFDRTDPQQRKPYPGGFEVSRTRAIDDLLEELRARVRLANTRNLSRRSAALSGLWRGDSMTSDAMIDAYESLGRFTRRLETYDDPTVGAVADALADSSPLSIDVPDLTTDEWLSVLETTAGELYLFASDDEFGTRTYWYLRHDGEAFIYGTKDMGELYRGGEDKNAYRQARSVISNHDVRPYPMDNYPLETPDEYQEVPADR